MDEDKSVNHKCKTVLLVGEGDFSFAVAYLELAALKATCSSLDDSGDNDISFEQSVQSLLEEQLSTGVDAAGKPFRRIDADNPTHTEDNPNDPGKNPERDEYLYASALDFVPLDVFVQWGNVPGAWDVPPLDENLLAARDVPDEKAGPKAVYKPAFLGAKPGHLEEGVPSLGGPARPRMMHTPNIGGWAADDFWKSHERREEPRSYERTPPVGDQAVRRPGQEPSAARTPSTPPERQTPFGGPPAADIVNHNIPEDGLFLPKNLPTQEEITVKRFSSSGGTSPFLLAARDVPPLDENLFLLATTIDSEETVSTKYSWLAEQNLRILRKKFASNCRVLFGVDGLRLGEVFQEHSDKGHGSERNNFFTEIIWNFPCVEPSKREGDKQWKSDSVDMVLGFLEGVENQVHGVGGGDGRPPFEDDLVGGDNSAGGRASAPLELTVRLSLWGRFGGMASAAKEDGGGTAKHARDTGEGIAKLFYGDERCLLDDILEKYGKPNNSRSSHEEGYRKRNKLQLQQLVPGWTAMFRLQGYKFCTSKGYTCVSKSMKNLWRDPRNTTTLTFKLISASCGAGRGGGGGAAPCRGA